MEARRSKPPLPRGILPLEHARRRESCSNIFRAESVGCRTITTVCRTHPPAKRKNQKCAWTFEEYSL